MDKLKIISVKFIVLCFLYLPDSGIDSTPQLHILTVNKTVASPDELVDLVGVTGAGLDVFTEDGRHTEHFLAAQVIS